jgi:hypothetical protein
MSQIQGTPPFVVLCWESDPSYVPPLRISSRQFTIGTHYAQTMNFMSCGEPPDIKLPAGTPYDLAEVMHRAGIVAKPDLIVVWSSALRANMPVNLGAFRCPKLLICGDTHHMQRPIGTMIDYARREAFDAIASVYDRHHLHWFLAAGFADCAWLPGISVQHMEQPWHPQRVDQVAFVGQIGAMHGWRQRLLEQIAAADVPLRAGTATRAQAAAMYAQSLVSFNGSLNGDLNMRVFEVLSAGGFLLTDRLSQQAGLQLLLRPGQDFECYEDAEELLDKLAFYRRSPGAALQIAEQGAATYRRSLLAKDRMTVLRDWMLEGKLPDQLNPRHDLRSAISQTTAQHLTLRLAVYEMLQEQQRVRPGLSVLLSPDWPTASVMDVADLVRTRVSVIASTSSLRTDLARASLLQQIEFIAADVAVRRDWDIVLTTSSHGTNEPWRNRASRVVFADFGAGSPC